MRASDNAQAPELQRSASSWRWLLFPPAFVAGFFVPGFLVRLAWDLQPFGWPEWIMERLAEVSQAGVGGFCAVQWATLAAPRAKLHVAIGALVILALVIGGFSMISILAILGDWVYSRGTLLWTLASGGISLGCGVLAALQWRDELQKPVN